MSLERERRRRDIIDYTFIGPSQSRGPHPAKHCGPSSRMDAQECQMARPFRLLGTLLIATYSHFLCLCGRRVVLWESTFQPFETSQTQKQSNLPLIEAVLGAERRRPDWFSLPKLPRGRRGGEIKIFFFSWQIKRYIFRFVGGRNAAELRAWLWPSFYRLPVDKNHVKLTKTTKIKTAT